MSVTVQTIPQEHSMTTIKDVKEFFVPTILSFNLKKTTEDHLPAVETETLSSRQNGDISIEENEGMVDMSPKRKGNQPKQQTSSFLLEPFLSPVAPHIESSKENPVLNALFGGKPSSGFSPWTYVTRTSINNCHPFKKTELSHDLASDDIPIQIPKSLQKTPSRTQKSPNRRTRAQSCEQERPRTPEMEPKPVNVTQPKESNNTSSTLSLREAAGPLINSTPAVRSYTDSSIFHKRRRILSQVSLQVSKGKTQFVNTERLIQLRSIVDDAIKNHKVYSMTGCYNSVRKALKQRGWIEKIDSDVKGRRKINKFEEMGLYDAAFQFVQKYQTVAAMRLSMQTQSGFAHNDQIRYVGQGEAEIMNRMLRNVTEDLCWLSRPYPYYCWKDFDKFEMINRLPRAYFSNKVGLCNSLQQIQWFYETGVCSTQFPRTYNMSMKEEIDAFKDDFRLTASISTLKWFLQTYKNGGEKAVRCPEGKVDMNIIEFALRRCAEYVKTKQHEDIDIIDTPIVWEYQWDQFITQYYKLVNEGQMLKDTKEGVSIKAIVSNVQSMLNILKPYWPQFDIEGYQNFWIVKPGGRCCGAGIVIKNNLEHILNIVNPSTVKETRFVVQKYIERPLLIYNTKFDIRQWFLVTNVYPLTVWMYKESYLRFCSQSFTLKNTHESIHLCNNAVQRKYKNGKRDRGLPDENMWDCYTFQTYLKAIGHPDVWDKHIYPGMKEGFIGALLASQDSMERKKNCFELYGADFMISDTLTDGPWLIEINSNPAMDSSTSVTARMCPQVLEDIIKVVIDRRDNKNAPTGGFEMVFRQNCPPIPPYLGMSLCVKGKKAYKSTGDIKTISRKSKKKNSSEQLYTDTEEESTAEETVSVENSSQDLNTSNFAANSQGEERNQQLPSNTITKITSTEFVNSNNSKNINFKKDDKNKKKIDWIQKNIEDLKSNCTLKTPKVPSSSASCGSTPRKESTIELKAVFTDQILKLLSTMEMKDFLRAVMKVKKEMKENVESKTSNEGEDLIVAKMEIMRKRSNGSLVDITNEIGISQDIEKLLGKLLKICKQKAEGEDIEWKTTLDELKSSCETQLKLNPNSCPNFDTTFEIELKKVEDKEEGKPHAIKSECSLESYLSATSLNTIKSTSKTSLEYFRDWKSKLSETKKNCEDMLAKLQVFQEENSKVKFQDALKQRMKDEVDFINRIRQLKKSKKLGKGKSVKRERQKEGTEKGKVDDIRSGWRIWDSDGDGALTPLAINSETGAVRAINDCLPKIKQRIRPSIPNGSSGHGRKIDPALEQTFYYN